MPVPTTPFLPQKESYAPTHPDLFRIQFADGDFNSCLKAQRVSGVLQLELCCSLWKVCAA